MTDQTGGKPLPEVNDLDEIFASAEAMVRNARLDRELAELIAAAEECAARLEAEFSDRFPRWNAHPVDTLDARSYERNMTPVHRLRAAVAKVRGS